MALIFVVQGAAQCASVSSMPSTFTGMMSGFGMFNLEMQPPQWLEVWLRRVGFAEGTTWRSQALRGVLFYNFSLFFGTACIHFLVYMVYYLRGKTIPGFLRPPVMEVIALVGVQTGLLLNCFKVIFGPAEPLGWRLTACAVVLVDLAIWYAGSHLIFIRLSLIFILCVKIVIDPYSLSSLPPLFPVRRCPFVTLTLALGHCLRYGVLQLLQKDVSDLNGCVEFVPAPCLTRANGTKATYQQASRPLVLWSVLFKSKTKLGGRFPLAFALLRSAQSFPAYCSVEAKV